MPNAIVKNWRASKRKHTGNIKITDSAIVEACYKKKYADVLIACTEPNFCDENVRFIVAVNLLEYLYAGNHINPNHNLDKYEWIPNTNNVVTLMSWIIQQFVSANARTQINVDSALRNRTCNHSSPKQALTNLRACRGICARMLRDMATNYHWQSMTPYIKVLWAMNNKLSGNSNGNVGQTVTKAANRKLQLSDAAVEALKVTYY